MLERDRRWSRMGGKLFNSIVSARSHVIIEAVRFPLCLPESFSFTLSGYSSDTTAISRSRTLLRHHSYLPVMMLFKFYRIGENQWEYPGICSRLKSGFLPTNSAPGDWEAFGSRKKQSLKTIWRRVRLNGCVSSGTRGNRMAWAWHIMQMQMQMQPLFQFVLTQASAEARYMVKF